MQHSLTLLGMLFSAEGTLGGWLVPAIVVALAIAFMLIVRYAVSRRKNVAPGRLGIFYGREFTGPDGKKKGFMLLASGGRVQRPIIEDYTEVSVEAFQLDISESKVPNKDNVPVTVEGVATCKISTDPANLEKAISSLLSKLTGGQKGEATLEAFVQNILTGHLRSIVGQMDMGQLIRDRQSFNDNLVRESKTELASLGIDLINLAIKDIRDEEGFIVALGKKAVASAKADAAIEVSNAEMRAEKTKAENAASVAAAQKDSNVKQAQYQAETATEQAKAAMASQIETASQEKTLRVAEADRDAAQKEAQIAVQEKEAARMTAELQATLVASAKANADKAVIDAEAARKTKQINAEADAAAKNATAEANKNAAIKEGEGIAAATRARLLAEAEGKAAETKQRLLGEAEGTQAMAKALGAMQESARLIILIEKIRPMIPEVGDAGAKMLEAVFKSVAAPLGQIDSVNIVDMGGGNGTNGMHKLASIVPKTVFDFLAMTQALGLDFGSLLKKIGLDPTKALEILGAHTKNDHAEVPAAVAAPAAEVAPSEPAKNA